MRLINNCSLLTLVIFLGLAACDSSDSSPQIDDFTQSVDSINSNTLLPSQNFNLFDYFNTGLDSTNYLPMAVDNAWKIKDSPLKTVTDVDTVNGKLFYLVETEGTGNNSTYYHFGKDGNIYDSIPGYPMALKFDLNAPLDKERTWIGDWQVTLQSKTDTVKLGRYQVTNCYRFYFNLSTTADEEHWIFLAPGIGFVREDRVMMGSFSLVYTVLNGRRFDFE